MPRKSLVARRSRRRCSARSSIHLTGSPVLAADRGEKDDVGQDRLLDAEAAAAARRRDQPQLVAGYAQSAGHQRLDDKGPLEIRPHRKTVGGALEMRDDAEGLHRRRCVTRVGVRKIEHSVGFRKSLVRIAVSETAPVDDIPAQRCRRPQRPFVLRQSGHNREQYGNRRFVPSRRSALVR